MKKKRKNVDLYLAPRIYPVSMQCASLFLTSPGSMSGNYSSGMGEAGGAGGDIDASDVINGGSF